MSDPNVPNGSPNPDDPLNREPVAPPPADAQAPPASGASTPATPLPPPTPPVPPAPPVYGATPGQPYAAPYPGAATRKSPVFSIISMITGILGVIISLFSFGFGGFIFSVAGVVLGFIGRKKEPAAKGMWLTGLITGFVGIVLSIILWILLGIAIAIAANNPGTFSY